MASETLAKIDRAYDVVGALFEGKREWLMSIPARPDHDPDLIIGDALLAARNEISRLTRELEEARERERALREALVEVAIPLEAFWMVMHDSDLLSAEVREAVQKALGIVRRALATHTIAWSEGDANGGVR